MPIIQEVTEKVYDDDDDDDKGFKCIQGILITQKHFFFNFFFAKNKLLKPQTWGILQIPLIVWP